MEPLDNEMPLLVSHVLSHDARQSGYYHHKLNVSAIVADLLIAERETTKRSTPAQAECGAVAMLSVYARAVGLSVPLKDYTN